MLRLSASLSCLALCLLVFASACDNGDDSGDDTAAETTGPAPQPCGTEWAEKSGTGTSIMDMWGAPCMSSADCVPLLGEGAECITNILGVYDLPGGFCSKYCDLPDSGTSFLLDSEQCDPAGGVACVGAQGLFTACIIPCTSSDECGREGYGCRTMPTLAAEGDPTFCLMSPTDCCTTDSGECAP